uniref:Zinc finger protein 593 homolog n=1 Tax=Tetranychus urticae TaxID=32264 RepID=T1L2D0_TETUR
MATHVKTFQIPTEPDDDFPGQGLFPCQACSRHFIDEQALDKHIRSKAHKKRLRELKEPAYTHAEAEAAGGLGNFIPPKRRKTSNMEVS